MSQLLSIIAAAAALFSNPGEWKWTVTREGDSAAIPAPVPGTVARAYQEAGLLEDIRYDDNLTRMDDEFYNADFTYRTSFRIPASEKGNTLILNFDGINWKADVLFNDVMLGRIEGAFTRADFDITAQVRFGKENKLEVRIHHNDNPGKVKIPTLEKAVHNGGVLGKDNPTFHASIGWDWIPTVPGRNMGIWNDVRISSLKEGVCVSDAFFDSVIPGLQPRRPVSDAAEIHPTVTVTNYTGQDKEIGMRITFGDSTVDGTYTLVPGRNDITAGMIRIGNPRLWWPVGYGEPYLYDARVELLKDGEVINGKTYKCGVRQMQYTMESSALQMFINGRRFIPHGGNWGFSEVNLAYTAREYDIAVRYHRDMGLNMIRNWVGQTGDDELYEACDRYGVVIWQDFCLANPNDGPDPADEKMFMDNSKDVVYRIRNHPSIGLWCGRNEGNPPRELEIALNGMVTRLCPNSIYITSSADYCVSGRGPYRTMTPREIYSIELGKYKFHSERGEVCIPTYESLCRMFREEHRWPQNDVWAMHNFTLGGAQKCRTFNEILEKGLGSPSSLKEFADRAQWVNYNDLRALFEARGSNRNGLLLWMSHPAWPCLVFQTYDYYFDVNGGCFGAKKACQPLHISWNPVEGIVEVVNESAGDLQGLEAEACIVNMDGSTAFSQKAVIDSREDSTVKMCDLPLDIDGLTDVFFIKLKLSREGKVLADNFYWEGREEGDWKAVHAMNATLGTSFRQVGPGELEMTVTNKSPFPAPMIRLNLTDSRSGQQILPAFYSDNYFGLLGGESRTVTVQYLTEQDYVPALTAEQLR